jgi:hypothetical protein
MSGDLGIVQRKLDAMQPLTVILDDELAERVAAVAAERGVAPEDLARDLIGAQLPAPASPRRARFAFAGMGHSGRDDLSSSYKQLRREALADKSARDV